MRTLKKKKIQKKNSLSASAERREQISRRKQKGMKEHSQTEEYRGRGLSGQGKKEILLEALTL